MTKPKYLIADYTCYVTYDIEDIEKNLDISWDDVEGYWVKWNVLHLEMKNGAKYEISEDPGEIDWKRPTELALFDKNWDIAEKCYPK